MFSVGPCSQLASKLHLLRSWNQYISSKFSSFHWWCQQRLSKHVWLAHTEEQCFSKDGFWIVAKSVWWSSQRVSGCPIQGCYEYCVAELHTCLREHPGMWVASTWAAHAEASGKGRVSSPSALRYELYLTEVFTHDLMWRKVWKFTGLERLAAENSLPKSVLTNTPPFAGS